MSKRTHRIAKRAGATKIEDHKAAAEAHHAAEAALFDQLTYFDPHNKEYPLISAAADHHGKQALHSEAAAGLRKPFRSRQPSRARRSGKRFDGSPPADRLLDMPLFKRSAVSAFVFRKGDVHLQLENLEEPLVWKLDLARTAKAEPEDLAAALNAVGSRHTLALDGVDAAPVDPPADVAAKLDGLTEFGLQTPDDHEYFLSKFGDLVGVLRVQRKAGGEWKAGLAKSNVPRVLSAEAVEEGLMPPPGHSGLPRSLEAVVPEEFHYWKSSGDEARQMRDALVEHAFFSDDCIKAVDGELRKVEVKYFLVEPTTKTALTKGTFHGNQYVHVASAGTSVAVHDHHDDQHALHRNVGGHEGGVSPRGVPSSSIAEHRAAAAAAAAAPAKKPRRSKRFEPPTLASRVSMVIPLAMLMRGFTPMADEDWLESLDKQDGPNTLAILSPGDRSISPREMVRAVKSLAGEYMLEHDDSRATRGLFSDAGVVFKLRGEPSRVFCSSFAPQLSPALQLLKAAPLKTVEFGGLTVSIDRPQGFVQTGKDADGNEWSREYLLDYGFIPRTAGGDGEELDVFLGPDTASDRVFWVTQNKADGSFDEFKVFLGFSTPSEAYKAYVDHIPVKFYGGMSETPLAQVRALAGVDPVVLATSLGKAALDTGAHHGLRTESFKRGLRVATTKSDGDERYVLGIVLEPDTVDSQNDVYTSDEIRKASERFMEEYRTMGLMHTHKVDDHVQILENFLAPCDMEIGGQAVKKGTWLMGVRVKDASLWNAVKSGQLTGFSIGGSAVRTPIDAEV